MKHCSKCQRDLPLSDFIKDKHNKDGYTGQCKACRNAKKKEYRERRQDKIKAYQYEYDRQRREQKQQELQRWIEQYKDQIALIKTLKQILKQKRRKGYYKYDRNKYLEYYRKNRDVILAKLRERYAKYPHIQFYNRQKRQKRKALERQQVATLTWEQWQECLSYFNHECVYCGSKDNITQEHLVPLSRGGSYTKHNIVPACRKCNLGRKARRIEEWYKVQSFFNEERLRSIRRWQYNVGQEGLFEEGATMKWK